MLSLRKLAPVAGLSLQDVPEPVPGPDEVLLRVRSTGVCGTDLHIDHWTRSYHFMVPALPVTIGHEFSGEIAALGEGAGGLRIGQLVTARPSVTCGTCAACSAGRPDECTQRRGIGVLRDGAFAEQVVVPARNCLPVPEGVSPEVAALAEPLSVSWQAVRVAGVQPGDRVLVLGPGNIGQGIALFARAAGARDVVVAGFDDGPRFEVLRRLGFDDLVDFAHDGAEALARHTAAGKFDVVLEATGSAQAVNTALGALRTNGVLAIAGIHAAPVPVDLTALVSQQHQLRGSFRAPEAAWPEILSYMQAHHETLRHLITHRVPLQDALEGFALARQKQGVKVMVQSAD
jgi:threonine dehydrogenase-like Zn-dependent dehydrogenase